VVASHEQLGDSYETLVEGRGIEILDANGKPLELDLNGLSRTIRVGVSLEDLSPVAPAIWGLGLKGDGPVRLCTTRRGERGTFHQVRCGGTTTPDSRSKCAGHRLSKGATGWKLTRT